MADVLDIYDYYAFGSVMPGRSFNAGSYEYGFNGKRMDSEIKGVGNSYDFGARMYDPRIGRWFSPDPKEGVLPGISTYHFSFNNPILFIDPDGEIPMTPKETRVVLDAFVQAINLYAVSRARADFETNFNYLQNSQEVTKPTGVGVEVSGLRKYDDSWMSVFGSNQLESPVLTMVNGKVVEAEISYNLSDIEGQNTITSIQDEGLTNGFFSKERYRIGFRSNTNRDMGALEFADTKKGKAGYEAFTKVTEMIYKAAYYGEAIKYDQENNIDYNSEHSTQNYLDKLDPDYKKAYDTKIDIKVKDNKVAIKYGKGKEKVNVNIKIKND